MNYARLIIGVGLLANALAALALPPVISLIYPPQLATFSAPATLPLTVSTSDPDGSVVKVEYFLGTTSLGYVSAPIPAGPFSIPLNNVGAGTYTFSTKATDNLGEETTSTAATITVFSAAAGNAAPAVLVPLPVSGSAYSLNNGPVVVPIVVNASDTGGPVNRVEMYVNGGYAGSVLGGTLNSGFVFNNPGAYPIVARAYDNLGVSTDSAATTVNVYAAGGGNTPPTASVASPLPGASYLPSATIPITATATDSGGSISRVEFYLNDSLLNVMTAGPYTFGIGGLATGNYAFRVRAYDNLGVYTDSQTVSIVVNTLPVVGITAPANNAVITAPASFNLQANATDTDGNLSKVEFYQGTTLLGEDASPPYSWSLNNVTWGTYAYTAKAYDALGAVITSNTINVIVNQPPTIGLTASSAYGGYNAPADILLTASPADVDGTISKVEFYSGSQPAPINTRTVPPYTYTVPGAPAGNYTYTAKVYDNRSVVTTSSPVSVTVSNALSPSTYTYDELGRLIGIQH